jgi:glycosyltransferase involved in cell wall biosynthesis
MNHKNFAPYSEWRFGQEVRGMLSTCRKVAKLRLSRNHSWGKPMTVAILDDLFPWKGSGFRFAEFDYLLKNSSDIKVFSTLESLGFVNQLENKGSILKNLPYGEKFQTVRSFDEVPKMQAYYCIFLNNLSSIIKLAERDSAPFAFTLYPGGGFHLYEKSFLQLRSIFEHPLFHTVIVTQPKTLEVVKKLGCAPEKIKYIFGVVAECKEANLHSFSIFKLRQKVKGIVWAAHRYEDLGHDKGLDLFIQMADEFISRGSHIKFHVIGPWRDAVAALSKFPDSYLVYEVLPIERLVSFFSKIDVAVFPTRPNINFHGRFDGFPTATMVQAAIAGAITVSTNPLGQVTPLIPDVHYIEIEATLESLNAAIHKILKDPKGAARLAKQSQKKFMTVYSRDSQLASRLEVINSLYLP